MPAPLVSPEVHSDKSVTFRFRAPNAQQVKLAREGAEPVDLAKDDQRRVEQRPRLRWYRTTTDMHSWLTEFASWIRRITRSYRT